MQTIKELFFHLQAIYTLKLCDTEKTLLRRICELLFLHIFHMSFSSQLFNNLTSSYFTKILLQNSSLTFIYSILNMLERFVQKCLYYIIYQKKYFPFMCRVRTFSHQFFVFEFSEEYSVFIIFSHIHGKNNTTKKYIPYMKLNWLTLLLTVKLTDS